MTTALSGDVLSVPLRVVPDRPGVDLPAAGVTVRVAGVYWQMSSAADRRNAIEPDVPVALGSSAFFRGKDPVLAAALAYRAGR